MKKTFKTLTKDLDLLTSQTQDNINIYTSSIFAIMQYKLRLQKKKRIEHTLSKLNDKKNKFISKYDKKIDKILNDSKITCRKYCKMEPWLTYKKEKFLYKYGYISKRPISPTAKAVLSKIFSHSNFLNSSSSNSSSHKQVSNNQITNIAIKATKKCIKGYQKLKQAKKTTHKAVLRNSLIKKLLYIKNEALQQLEEEKKSKKSNDTSDFLKRIQLDPKIIMETSKFYQPVKNKSTITHMR